MVEADFCVDDGRGVNVLDEDQEVWGMVWEMTDSLGAPSFICRLLCRIFQSKIWPHSIHIVAASPQLSDVLHRNIMESTYGKYEPPRGTKTKTKCEDHQYLVDDSAALAGKAVPHSRCHCSHFFDTSHATITL